MNESKQMINDPRKCMQIFSSLMSVEFHAVLNKTQVNINKELKELENQGKLRIYYPEARQCY